MKPKLSPKSPAELQDSAREITASLRARAALATRHGIIEAHDRSAAIVRAIVERAITPPPSPARTKGWSRGGLNE